MMTFFPIPCDDEVLYSILARYHIRSGNISAKSTLGDIYSKTSVTSVMDLPSHIDRIVNNMPIGSKYTSDNLVFRNTLFPFYSAFLPKIKSIEIKNFMKGDEGGSIYNKIGLMASSISLNQYFRFCPQCIKEDMNKYGELYWHRVHQIPGVFVCPQHKVMLKDSKVPVRGFNKHEYRHASFEVCNLYDEVITYSGDILNHLTNIAVDAECLLNANFENKPIEWFRNQFINRLMEYGYANINGNINQKKLLTDFRVYFGDKVLSMLQCSIDTNTDCNWLSDILRRVNKMSHPIRYFLVARFLRISIHDLFNKVIKYKPFGDGPWPCLNLASGHYRNMEVFNIDIKHGNESKMPIGIFRCHCGFTYKRTGPDQEPEDKYKITKIVEFGSVWEEELKRTVNKKLSLRETARQLGVDPATIKKYSMKLGLVCAWNKNLNTSKTDTENLKKSKSDNIEFELCRKLWLDLVKQFPDMSKSELRKIDNSLFTWLYRNDKNWLNDNSPIKKINNQVSQRVNWGKRDQEILKIMKKAVNEIHISDGKPIRITLSVLGSRLGVRPLLEKHLEKLPNTKSFLETVLEDNKQYRIRRIKWAIEELIKEQQELKEWKIFRKAGIRPEYQQELISEINKII